MSAIGFQLTYYLPHFPLRLYSISTTEGKALMNTIKVSYIKAQ